ncbi:MAG TPA: DegT/DnrJ/EryC1/StrS family aminotransferase [Acidothermaceae bacterium]
MTAIPLARPDLSPRETAYVTDAIHTSWIASAGPYLERFESEFAEMCGTRHALAVSNGTVALHLALLGLGIGPGDEVIVPSLTYIASVNAVTYVGARPVFVDVDPVTWCIDPAAVALAVTPQTRAIMAVHLYGQPADMDALRSIARAHALHVVEDAAEAPCASYGGRPTGSLGDVATFSFYGNKILTSGEGGALTSDDDDLTARMKLFRGQGMDLNRRYFFPVIGYNYRLTNIAAALLCAQMERRHELIERRTAIFARYTEGLRDIRGLELQADVAGQTRALWLYSVLVGEEFGRTRDDLAAALAEVEIETRPFFIPVHTLPPYASASTSNLSVTMRLARDGINLPTFSQMTDVDVDKVCAAIASAAR